MATTYTVALLCGGTSNEREVSFASAQNVEKTLAAAGHRVVKIDTANKGFHNELEQLRPDVAFIALHGKGGEDGTIQAVLELLDIPYTGSGVLGSALAMDKHRSKIIYESLGLNTPAGLLLKKSAFDEAATGSDYILKRQGLPVVVKPCDSGSSFGVTIVRDEGQLEKAVAEAFATSWEVLIEQYISGTEITVAVIGGAETMALTAIEIIPKNEFYDYESKYAEGGSDHIIPARLSQAALAEAYRAALLAHEGLNCYGVSRTDMIVDAEDKVWVFETNTIPGMTGTSLLPDAALHKGISNLELYESFIKWALERPSRP